MTPLPFGQTIVLWRAHLRLTQEALARKAGIPRPNLSAIERGRREVTLPTIRMLAATLGVRPGTLVDGVPPASAEGGGPSLSRQAIERLANAVALNQQVQDPQERMAVEALRLLLAQRRRAAAHQWGRPRVGRRRLLAAWLQLKSVYGRSAIQTLAERILERQRA